MLMKDDLDDMGVTSQEDQLYVHMCCTHKVVTKVGPH